MQKIIHVVRISNFRIFLVDFSPDFKHIVLSRLDELSGLSYMIGKFEISSSQPNMNNNKISPVYPDMSQIVHGSLV
jgi:hypothetical protein